MIKFEMLEVYRKQQQEHLAKVNEMYQKVQEAKSEVDRLRSERDQQLRELAQGVNNTAKLDELEDGIQLAERRHKQLEQAAEISSRIPPSGISLKQLETSFRSEYVPAFHKETMQPLLNELHALKIAYVKKELEIEAAEKHFENERHATYYTVDPSGGFFAGALGSAMPFHTQSERDKYFINGETLRALDRKQLPKGVSKGDLENNAN
jgi:chromosome segregation ATPase